MKVQRIFWCTVVALLGVGLAGNAMAGWKEDQEAMFQQITVKPGDKIDASNWEKVKDLLPDPVVNWVKKGDFILAIGDFKWDYNNDKEWLQASSVNEGKYDIGAENEIIEKATGKQPDFIHGIPFPNIDWKNDPKAGAKIAYNSSLNKSRAGSYDNPFVIDWVGRQGLERWIAGNTLMKYFWGISGKQHDNPGKHLANMVVQIKRPYDLAGMVSMTLRSISPAPDNNYAYIPAIRRVKKLSGTVRSSPFLGTDFTNDDGQGFDGKIETMNWNVVDQKVILMPISKWATEGPAEFTKQADGSWMQPAHLRGPRNGFEVEGWKGAPWAPVDVVYVPRVMYVVETKAKDLYYNYGDTTFYVDPVAGFTYKVINDRAGDYWKTLLCTYLPASFDNKITVAAPNYYVIVDDKSDHASISNCFGTAHQGNFNNVIYNDPKLTVNLFSPTALPALSK